MKKILAFFGIGVMILLLDLIFNYDEDELNIFISDQEIESLIYTWELQVGRSPTKEDIKNIIDKHDSGNTRVVLSYKTRDFIAPINADKEIYVKITDNLLSDIKSITGDDSVSIKYQ